MSLGEWIERLRDHSGLTQEQFAKRLSVSQPTVSRWIAGAEPGLGNMNKLRKLAERLYYPAFEDATEVINLGPIAIRRVPLLSWVSAGRLTEVGAPLPKADKSLAFAGLGSGDFFALKVSGDSMDRVSPDGSVIVVNREDREPVPGKPFIFSIRGEATYKYWQPKPSRLEPFSTNPMNRAIFPESDEDFLVVGRVRRTVLDL